VASNAAVSSSSSAWRPTNSGMNVGTCRGTTAFRSGTVMLTPPSTVCAWTTTPSTLPDTTLPWAMPSPVCSVLLIVVPIVGSEGDASLHVPGLYHLAGHGARDAVDNPARLGVLRARGKFPLLAQLLRELGVLSLRLGQFVAQFPHRRGILRGALRGFEDRGSLGVVGELCF